MRDTAPASRGCEECARRGRELLGVTFALLAAGWLIALLTGDWFGAEEARG